MSGFHFFLPHTPHPSQCIFFIFLCLLPSALLQGLCRNCKRLPAQGTLAVFLLGPAPRPPHLIPFPAFGFSGYPGFHLPFLPADWQSAVPFRPWVPVACLYLCDFQPPALSSGLTAHHLVPYLPTVNCEDPEIIWWFPGPQFRLARYLNKSLPLT